MQLTLEKKQFEELLTQGLEMNASDIHLSSDGPVSYRVNGSLIFQDQCIIDEKCLVKMAASIMTERQKKEFQLCHTVDLGYSTFNGERFRVNCFMEQGKPAMAVRHLDQAMLSFEQLGLPPSLRDLAYLPSGLVLVTGATGSGKSSTLAVMLDEINRNRQCHILTVEDPVEFIHFSKKSLVHHREVHTDVPGFAEAVRASLREDPDVIMVGEMRDLETMQASITAAETGHLVFSTLHTGEAVGAVERFIGYFSGAEQAVARHRIAMVLKAVIAQRLVRESSGLGRVPALEMLKVTTGAANLIQNSKSQQLYSMMESGAKDGMWTMDQDLARLVRARKVNMEDALRLCKNPAGFDRLVSISRSGGR